MMRPETVIDFWFGAPGSPERGRSRAIWFKKDAAFDADLRSRFGALHAEAAAGRLSAWEGTPLSSLALVIVLDQFSRNLFRGWPASFACDAAALALAKRMVAHGVDVSDDVGGGDGGNDADGALLPVMRSFVYLPFEHSEHLADQDEAVRLFTLLTQYPDTAGLLEWAQKHCDVIRRFGRFPHRNAILGRASTPVEIAFLQQPGSSF